MKEAHFFDAIRKTLFGGKLTAAQVSGINGILQAMDEVGDGDQDTLAYALATAYHETGRRMVPVREGFATTDAGARKAVAKLAAKRGPKSAPARYGAPAGPYGHAYYGRGHVQLTWLKNYQGSSADAGVDLVKNPDAMLDPKISARVLIRGIMDGRWNGQGKGISHYEGADDKLSDAEAEEARRLVNVKDKAKLIAGYHRKFYDALDVANWEPKKAAPPKPAAAPKNPAQAQAPAKAPPIPEGAKSAAGGLAGGGVALGVVAFWDQIAAFFGGIAAKWEAFWVWVFSAFN